MGGKGFGGILVLRVLCVFVSVLYFSCGFMVFLNVLSFLTKYENLEIGYLLALTVFGIAYISVTTAAFFVLGRGKPLTIFIYGCVLAIIWVTTLGGYMAVYVNLNSIREDFRTGLNMTVITATPTSPYMEYAQNKWKCCGVNNYTDWVNFSPARVIPMSCCHDEDRCVTANYNDVYQKGCREALLEAGKANIFKILCFIVAVPVLPGLSSMLAFLLGAKLETMQERNIVRVRY